MSVAVPVANPEPPAGAPEPPAGAESPDARDPGGESKWIDRPEEDPPGVKALDRFLWLVAKDVDGDAVLAGKFTEEESARLHELERLERAGELPQEDGMELQSFRDVAHFSAILKAAVDQIRNGWTGPVA